MEELKHWWQEYPQGTQEGDEENRFFCALARHPEHKYRTVEELSDDSLLTVERVEDIIAKYAQIGLVLQNPKNPDQWGYWERVGRKLYEPQILEEEHEARLKKALKCKP